ncbi:hypothetical protein FQP90_21150 [Paenarthrobacter nitroguajacolicus]|uniref:Uncharacterized protein n=1 Tax=Paenarthrobacter nitroguajacolicus TaxID=211146 RepID=A0A558GNJ9_PAENT|nr:hypothetical protein [Paenarthrobacter nitroguajacolicus]TVU58459.1 hypothetical protein FQP90_21150 [Paenarthrobacter nitroguajacolicus]
MPEPDKRPTDKKSRAKPGRGLKSAYESLGGFTKGMITWLGAVASLVAALVGATYLVAPDLKPRDKLGAAVDRIGIQQDIAYCEYEAKLASENSECQEGPDARRGVEVVVHASLNGFSDRIYFMRVTLLDSETLRAIAVAHSGCEGKSPKANEDGVTWRCWSGSPPAGTSYIVRAELFDDGSYAGQKRDVARGHVLLDFIDSQKITSVPQILG